MFINVEYIGGQLRNTGRHSVASTVCDVVAYPLSLQVELNTPIGVYSIYSKSDVYTTLYKL